MRIIAFIAAGFLATACATAQTVSPPAPTPNAGSASPVPAALPTDSGTSFDPAAAPAGDYALDPRHAAVIWRVRHTGLGLYTARFDTVAATLSFDPQHPENSKIDATIDVNSVSTGLVGPNGQRDFDHEIAGVLGGAANPQIHFVSTSAVRTGPTTGLVTGDLTLNGQTHPATMEVTFQGGRFVQLRGKYTLAFSGRTIINRRQWDVGSTTFNLFTGDDVEILIEGEFPKS